MYWLVYFNGDDIPEVEAAFAEGYCLFKYAEVVISEKNRPHYNVFCPDGSVVPFKVFYDEYKEF